MSDAVFAVILALGGLGVVGFGVVMLTVPRIEACERRRMSKPFPAE